MNQQHISNVLWALAVVQHFDQKLFKAAFALMGSYGSAKAIGFQGECA